MGALTTQAIVSDVVTEFQGTGSGPYTLFNVAGVTSGAIYDKITEANATLQSWVSLGDTTPSDAAQKEAIKRFEVSYASARLAATLFEVQVTDAFNYNIGGLSVQRQTAQFQAAVQFIKDHMEIAQNYIRMLHQWFVIYNPTFPQGYSERGTPISYWSTSQSRY